MRDSRWQPSLLIRASVLLHVLAAIALIAFPAQWPWTVGTVLANHALLTFLGLWPRSHGLGDNWTQLPAAAAARNEIALTIDDGPDPDVTPQVLDILDRHEIRATFFCIGDKVARYPDLCREIVRRGHAMENHSQHHAHTFSLLGYNGFMREIQSAQATLTGVTGQRPLFFRAPAGLRNPLLDPALGRLDLILASWSVRAFDTRNRNAARVKHTLLRGLRPGAIVLIHDGNAARTTAGTPVILEVLPAVIRAASDAKLHFVTLRQAMT